MAPKRFIRQTLKTITVATLIGFVAFGSLMIIPASHAAAAIDGGNGGGPAAPLIESFGPDVQAQIYSSIKLALSSDCNFATATGQHGLTSTGISPEDIVAGKWFKNKGANGGDTGNIGQHVSPGDGMVSCANGNNWFSTLLNQAGLSGGILANAATIFDVNSDGTYSVKDAKNASNAAIQSMFQRYFYNGVTLPSTAPLYIAYEILKTDFASTAPKACNAVLAPSAPDAYAVAAAGHTAADIYTYDPTTKQVLKQKYLYKNSGNAISVGHGLGVGSAANAQAQCNTIANALGNSKYANALKAYFADPSHATVPPDGAGGAGGAGATHATCESGGFGLNWILCPIFNAVAGFSDWLFSSLVQPLLRTAPISTNPSDPSFKIWSNFRIYGDIFLVIALLVVVFGQSIGGGLIDAYTAKKVLPRLLAAAVLINLSIYIVAFMVDMTNIIGGGLGTLITAPLAGAGAFSITPSGVQAGVIAGVPLAAAGIGAYLLSTGSLLTLVGGAIPSLSVILLFVVMPAILGLLVAFVTLLLRKAIILALVLVSPVAFAMYCLPNTEKYFRQWWSLFAKTLAVYPIVIVIFAIADVMAVTVSSANNSNDPLASIISFVLQFLPLLLIGFAFKMAGGAIGQMHGVITGHSKRLQEGVKGNANNPLSARNRALRGWGSKFNSAEGRAISPGEGLGATRRQQRSMRFIKGMDRGWNARASRYTAEAQQKEDQESNTGRDGDRYAANYQTLAAGQQPPLGLTSGGAAVTGPASSLRYFDAKGRQINEGYALSSASQHASTEHDAGRNLEYALRKAQTDDDVGNYRRSFAATALRMGLDQDEIGGLHARSAFEHKDKHPSEWYSSPSLVPGPDGNRIVWSDVSDPTPAGRRGQGALVNELHKTRESFKLSSLRDGDLRSWSDRRNEIQNQMDAGTPLNQDDARFFSQTDELLGSLAQQGVVTLAGDDGPQMSTSGVSAATSGVLKAMMHNRRYETKSARTGVIPATGQPEESMGDRVIYNREQVALNVANSIPRNAAGQQTGPATLSGDDAKHAAAVPILAPLARGTVGPQAIGSTVAVTGDAERSSIPRFTP